MADSLIFINFLIFILLSFLHFYWALGGKWAIDYTIPDQFKEIYFNKKNQTKIFYATLMVAIGLLLFSCIIASNFKNPFSLINQNQITFLTRFIGVVFLIRAIGDFNIVGLFKQKNKSLFAIKDRQIFVPLCLYLGISSILITIL